MWRQSRRRSGVLWTCCLKLPSSNPLVRLCGPLWALSRIEAPEKGFAGRRRWKAAEELWQEDGNAPSEGPRGEGMRYIQRGSFPLLFQGGVARSAGVVLARSTTPPPAAAPLQERRG